MPDRSDRQAPTPSRAGPVLPVSPRGPRGWRFLYRIWSQFSANHLSILAAGVAFYGFLSLFPGLVALVSLYGLIADPAVVEDYLASLGGILPDAAEGVLADQLRSITAHSSTTLSYALVVSLLFAWWSAASAMKALMEALNIAYGEEERRSWWWFNIEALLLTLGAIVVMIHALIAVVVVPIVLKFLDWLGLPPEVGDLLAFARWPVLAVFITLGLAVLYRLGPSHTRPRWHWFSWGAVTATGLWLLGSALLSFYVSTFDTYNKTYGSLAAVVILMLWLELSAFLVILGAQINAELARGRAAEPERPRAA